MKRAVSLILTALVGISLISCGGNVSNGNTGAVIINMCDCCSSKLKDGVKIEFQEEHIYKNRFFAPKYKTVEIAGVKIKGEYSETLYTSDYNGVYDIYEGECEDGTKFSFRINKKTGEIKKYYSYSSDKDKTDIGKEEVAKKAQEYAKEYIDNGYILLETEDIMSGRETYFYYCKYVNGDYITDTVGISVDKSGNLAEINIDDAFKDGIIPEVSEEKSLKLIEDKLNEVLKEGVTSIIKEKRVRRFENGSYGVEYEIELAFENSDTLGTSTVNLLVYI